MSKYNDRLPCRFQILLASDWVSVRFSLLAFCRSTLIALDGSSRLGNEYASGNASELTDQRKWAPAKLGKVLSGMRTPLPSNCNRYYCKDWPYMDELRLDLRHLTWWRCLNSEKAKMTMGTFERAHRDSQVRSAWPAQLLSESTPMKRFWWTEASHRPKQDNFSNSYCCLARARSVKDNVGSNCACEVVVKWCVVAVSCRSWSGHDAEPSETLFYVCMSPSFTFNFMRACYQTNNHILSRTPTSIASLGKRDWGKWIDSNLVTYGNFWSIICYILM